MPDDRLPREPQGSGGYVGVQPSQVPDMGGTTTPHSPAWSMVADQSTSGVTDVDLDLTDKVMMTEDVEGYCTFLLPQTGMLHQCQSCSIFIYTIFVEIS